MRSFSISFYFEKFYKTLWNYANFVKKKKKNEISEILNEIKERYWKSHVIKTKNENIFQYKNN